MAALYETLNLKPNASLEDIKSAYRELAKRFHPDAAGGLGDSSRFQAIHEAYRALLNRSSGGGAEEFRLPKDATYHSRSETGMASWRFEGVGHEGADVVYVLNLSRLSADTGLTISLPWKQEDACPRCLGSGSTLTPVGAGHGLNRRPCARCLGQGVIRRNSSFTLDLTPDLIRQGRICLNGKGHYVPSEGFRGDLIIQLHVADDRRWSPSNA